jgi:hypothetical protein
MNVREFSYFVIEVWFSFPSATTGTWNVASVPGMSSSFCVRSPQCSWSIASVPGIIDDVIVVLVSSHSFYRYVQARYCAEEVMRANTRAAKDRLRVVLYLQIYVVDILLRDFDTMAPLL